MQNSVTLNRRYVDYGAGRLERKIFEGLIFESILKTIPCLPGLRKEDREDFFSWLYPRISAAVDRYRDVGSTFEAYLRGLVRLSAKEYRRRQTRARNAEAAAWIAEVPRAYAVEAGGARLDGLEAARKRGRGNAKNSRQLLMLTLKCCRHVSNDFVEKISGQVGMEPDALRALMDRLKENRKKREGQLETLRELANLQLCRRLFYERTLQMTRNDPEAAGRIKKRLEGCRKKLGKTRERLAKTRADPSNAQIAEVLGVTKGAVDSALHALKARWGIDEGSGGGPSLN